MKLKIIILFALSAFVMFSCKTRPLPECINKNTTSLTIRWGEQNKPKKEISGYLIQGDGKFFRFKTDSTKIEKLEDLGFVDGKWFCTMADSIQDAIVKTQVSNEPGDLTEFIEFSNPSASIYYRGQWVRKFKTKNSVLFRACFDSLQSYKIAKED